MKYSVVDSAGRVLSLIEMTPEDALLNVPDGCDLVEGWANTFTDRLVNDEWVDGRTMEQVRLERRKSINEARDRLEFSFFTWDGSVFDADEKSQARLQGAFQLANLSLFALQPYSVDWTLANNTVRTLSANDMVAVGQALAAHVLAAHSTARTLKTEIDAATTLAEVDAVAWPET